VVVNVLRCRLSEKWLLMLCVVGLLGCLSLAVKRRELQRTLAPVCVVGSGVYVVFNSKASRRQVACARIFALVPVADQRCKSDVEGRCSTAR
jgi:hypothetical protein